MFEKNVIFGAAGYCVEVYTEDEQGQGWIGYWYGSRAECEALSPRLVKLYPLRAEYETDSFELACERLYDE